MDERLKPLKMGWLPDYPDFRDYSSHHQNIEPVLKTMKAHRSSKAPVPARVDLREWCPPVEDQGSLGSCTANAGVGLIEYFERRAFGKHTDASRLFLYKVTRKLAHLTGDSGAYLRSTMGALALFGIPPEEYWPYVPAEYDKEPPSFCYAFAQNYHAIQYYRLDVASIDKKTLLTNIKINLARGLPAMFGFTVYDSISRVSSDGKIPYPALGEKMAGGHAILAVGYDDKIKIKNPSPKGPETTGAFLIRNSWGAGWGDKGYGWLPYEYLLQELAVDWWSLVKSEWVDTEGFKI